MESEVMDAEFSDAISEIRRADVESKGKKRREEPGGQGEGEGSPHKVKGKAATKKEKAPRAPAPAPAPFSFSSSGFASLEDAAASGEFVDLSGGRHSCLKRVDEAGLEMEGNPPQGSKVPRCLIRSATCLNIVAISERVVATNMISVTTPRSRQPNTTRRLDENDAGCRHSNPEKKRFSRVDHKSAPRFSRFPCYCTLPMRPNLGYTNTIVALLYSTAVCYSPLRSLTLPVHARGHFHPVGRSVPVHPSLLTLAFAS